VTDGEDRPEKRRRTPAEIASMVLIGVGAIGVIIVFAIVGNALR
jgi:hypothetical protein